MLAVIRDNHGVVHKIYAMKPFESPEDEFLMILVQDSRRSGFPYQVRVLDVSTSEFKRSKYAKTMLEAIRIFNSWYL